MKIEVSTPRERPANIAIPVGKAHVPAGLQPSARRIRPMSATAGNRVRTSLLVRAAVRGNTSFLL